VGKTTAGLPLRAGEHYEKCAACATVYRTKRRTRFRCPSCHALAYALATPEGEPGRRRSLEDDARGRVYRILEERPAADAAPPAFGDDVVVYLEDPEAPPAVDPPPAPTTRPGVKAARRGRSSAATDADRDRDRGPAPAGGIIRRIWRGSLGDVIRRG
jgi:hypothetical protein